jgi:replicative DNA helicase
LLQANVENLLRTHNDVWNFIRLYFDNNSSVPPASLVIEKFRDFVPVEGVGATKHHLEELQTEYLNDSLKDILRSAAGEVQGGNGTEALNGLITKTSELKKNTSAIRDIDATDLDSALAYFEKIQEQKLTGQIGIKTGLPGFDNYLPSGIMPGQLGVFLAYPGIGKSWLALYFAVQAWKQGKSPLVISLEMSETEVRNRVFAIMGEGLWSHRKLSNGEIELDMLKNWHANKVAGKPEFHIISNDNGGEVNPSVVRGKIDQYKPDFVIVDYLQLMSPNQKSENETVRMKNLSRELKLMAISEEVPIIAISSATPDDVKDLSSAPTLGQTAWSRQIAYDADWVMALGRATNSDIIECVFRKNRNGFMGDFLVQVDFDKGYYRYKDYEDDK